MTEFSKSISGWERASFEKTLTCMLKELEGLSTTVELRDETQITGVVDHVDGLMNISMSNVSYEKPYKTPVNFTNMKIHGRQIRFVHIPDQINMHKAIVKQLDSNRHDVKKFGTQQRQGYVAKKRKERETIMNKRKQDSQ